MLPEQRLLPGAQTSATQLPLLQLVPAGQATFVNAVPCALQTCTALPLQRLLPGAQTRATH